MSRGVTAEENAILAVSNGSLHQTKFGPAQCLATGIYQQERHCGDYIKTSLRRGHAKVVAKQEFKIRETIISTHQQAVTEEQQTGGIGKRLREYGKVHSPRARTKGEVTKNQRHHSGNEQRHEQRKQK